MQNNSCLNLSATGRPQLGMPAAETAVGGAL